MFHWLGLCLVPIVLFISYSESRFVGYDPDEKSLDAEVLKQHILGGHVSSYMKSLKESDEDSYKTQFALYIKDGVGPDEVYTCVSQQL